MNTQKVLLSTAYFPPVQYISKILYFPETIIEVYENYSKQSYRNRCAIYGANGLLTLSIPVVKEHNKKTLTKDVRIDYDTNWRKIHFKSIESAYRSSPFYEYYIDDIAPFFEKKYTFLVDLNTDILNEVLDLMNEGKKISIKPSEDYIEILGEEYVDYRDSIHPKKGKNKPDPFFQPQEYIQVFSDKHGFKPNLSILDLLFNEGSLACSKVMQSIITK